MSKSLYERFMIGGSLLGRRGTFIPGTRIVLPTDRFTLMKITDMLQLIFEIEVNGKSNMNYAYHDQYRDENDEMIKITYINYEDFINKFLNGDIMRYDELQRHRTKGYGYHTVVDKERRLQEIRKGEDEILEYITHFQEEVL